MKEEPDFEERLRSHGFRVTPGRLDILEVLWHARKPMSVEQIGEKVSLDTATLYRALSDLVQKGLLMRGISSGDIRAARFSYRNHAHHHHLVCSDCGFNKHCVTC
jgi:Fe2+ or Zn2+ uptake regulation protein